MRFLWPMARKDLLRKYYDPMGLLLWVSIPVVIGGLIILATGGGSGPKPMARLLLVDQDNSLISGLLLSGLGQGNLGDLIQVEKVTQQEGESRIREGDGSGLLVIPEGFGDALTQETPLELVLLTNPSQRILPLILEETLDMFADAVFYAHRVFGKEIQLLAAQLASDQVPASSDVAALAAAINDRVTQLSPYLSPPLISLHTALIADQDEQQAAPVSFGLLFLPGIVLMGLFFTAQGLSDDFWNELEGGTLRRLQTTPTARIEWMLGKMAACAVLLVLISLLVLALGFVYFDLNFVWLPLALGWATFSGLVLFLLMTTIQLHASSRQIGAVLTSAVLFPLLMIGGSFFPSETMPKWMAAIGRWTPNGLAVEQLKDILLDRWNGPALIQASVLLAAMLGILFTLSIYRLRRTLET